MSDHPKPVKVRARESERERGEGRRGGRRTGPATQGSHSFSIHTQQTARSASTPAPLTVRPAPSTPITEVTPLRGGPGSNPSSTCTPLTSAPAATAAAAAAAAGSHTFTVGDAIDAVGFGRFHFVLLALTGAVWAADAMEMMLLSFLGPAARCEWGLSSAQEAALSATVFGGMMVGAAAWGALSDAAGRRAAFFAPAIFTFVAGILSAAATSFPALLAARGAVGFGLGGAPVAFALFMEFAPSPSRGLALVAVQAFWTVGSVAEAGLAWAVLGTLGWRWLVALSSLPLLLLACLIPFVPESPFFLVAAGRTDEAAAVLARLAKANRASLPPGRLVVAAHAPATAGPARVPDPTCATAAAGVPPLPGGGGCTPRLRERASSLAAAVAAAGARAAELAHPSVRRNTAVLGVLWTVNALAYYSLVLLSTSTREGGGGGTAGGLKPGLCQPGGRLNYSTRDMAAIFIDACAELPGLLAAAAAIDWVGRRVTLGCALSVLAAATAALAATASGSTGGDAALFVARGAAMASYTALYIATPELYPTRVRSLALGLNSALSRVGALVSPALAVSAVRAGHTSAAEGALAGAAFIAALCVCGLKAETAGVQLPEEEADVGGAISPAEVRLRRASAVLTGAASAPLPALNRLSVAMRHSLDRAVGGSPMRRRGESPVRGRESPVRGRESPVRGRESPVRGGER